MNAYKDYYRTLGLTPGVSAEEIKKAYRKLAMKYHPDRNRDNPKSEERLKEINEAYQILSDEGKRRAYDFLYGEKINENIIAMLRKYPRGGFGMKRRRGCRRKGSWTGVCGRWKEGI